MTLRGAIAAACAALAVAAVTVEAAPGSLDPSFDVDGWRTINHGGFDEGNAVAVQPDGKIVVVGSGFLTEDITVTRLNADGSLDASFGIAGTVAVDFGGYDAGRAVAIQPDGKIIVAGDTSSLVDTNVAILRLRPDGSLDREFHGDGKRTIDQGGADQAWAVLVQPDGKVVVAGTGNQDIAVSRLLPDGSYDLTFHEGGTARLDFGGPDFGLAVALQPDGKIVVAGATSAGAATVVVRLDQSGVLDPTFDFDGVQTIAYDASSLGTAVALQPDGKIVVAGPGGNFEDFAIARLNPNGGADPSFAGSGEKLIDVGGEDYAAALVLQPNGKIVIVGSNDGDVAAVRLQPDGSLDPAFGGSGTVFLDFGSNEFGKGVALQPDGKLVVVGFTVSGPDVILARIEGDSPAVTPPGQPIPLQAALVKPGKLVTLVAKGTFTLPDPAGAPTTTGGTLTVSGATGSVTYALEAGSWTALGRRHDGTKGYRFKGAGCAVLVKARVLKAKCRGGTGTLAAPEPGPLDAVLAIGAGTRYCGACGGIARGNTERLFQRRACAAPASCP
jgi:uncharacterized delta-60 repeat protein